MQENQIQQAAVEQAAQVVEEKQEVAAEQKAEDKPEGEAAADEPEDPDKLPSWAKKKMRNMERRVNTLTKRLGGAEERLRTPAIDGTNQTEQDDSDSLSLSRQELAALIEKEAKKLAPVLKEQETVIEQRRRVAEGLAKSWGQDKFNALASDLDAAFDGLTDAKGQPKAAADAIFEADDPKSVIEYLADPDNAAEAAAIARMSAVQAGRAIAKLESKLEAKKSTDKPQASKADAPIEPERGRGTVKSDAPTDMAGYMAWANKQYARR